MDVDTGGEEGIWHIYLHWSGYESGHHVMATFEYCAQSRHPAIERPLLNGEQQLT